MSPRGATERGNHSAAQWPNKLRARGFSTSPPSPSIRSFLLSSPTMMDDTELACAGEKKAKEKLGKSETVESGTERGLVCASSFFADRLL